MAILQMRLREVKLAIPNAYVGTPQMQGWLLEVPKELTGTQILWLYTQSLYVRDYELWPQICMFKKNILFSRKFRWVGFTDTRLGYLHS